MSLKDIRPALRTFLLANGAISTAVGASRIYPVVLMPGVPAGPAIVYTLISERTDHHLQGPSGLVFARIQIDTWGVNSDLAQALALLVKERLDGYSGPMEYGSNSPRDSIVVLGVFSVDASFLYDAAANLHRVSRDFFVDYRER